jgi:multimeric flavodoxin WrbA
LEEALKVLGIFGSPRRGGNTDLLLEEALKGAEKEGAGAERLHLIDFSITPCRECHGCDLTGECVILDDMEKIYPKLLEADVIILASPVFFYGLTAWAKAFVDRCQAFWSRKYLLKDPSLGKEGKRRKGFLISVGGTKGQRVFHGIDAKGDILKHPEAIQQAFETGRKLVSGMRNADCGIRNKSS